MPPRVSLRRSTTPPRSSSSSNNSSNNNAPLLSEAEAYELRPLAHSVPAPLLTKNQDGNQDESQDENENEDQDEDQDERDLDHAHHRRRLSFDSVASYELYTPDEDRAVLRRLDRRLVGFMAGLYCLSFLDRTNIGNARIAGMQDDLRLSEGQFERLLWAFYATYIAFEWMTLLYRVIRPHVYIAICIFSWGTIACLQSVAPSFSALVLLRALLGIAEAAFGPGVPFYLSFFFRRRELAFRTGLFISASPLSSAFAGALAWLITKLAASTPFSPWRLLFLLEGFPSMLVAVWAWNFVPDGPGSVRWLTPRQRKVAVLRLRQEKEADDADELYPTQNRGVNLREILHTLKDPKSYLTAFMLFGANVAFGSIPVFLPTLVRDMGFSALTAQALTAPPYLVAFVAVLATAHYSDRLQSRSVFIILHALLASGAYTLLALLGYYESPRSTLRYFALYPAITGFFSCVTVIITWTLNNQGSDSGKGAGMALLNVVGQCGPLVGASVFPSTDGPWYVRGMAVCAGAMGLVGLLAGVLRCVLVRENQRARRGEGGEGGVCWGCG
ncbi:major facilitator superfamily domain-containing protein [Boeremia exigua]|uniref:major facilitator superfamily domain-containing protein n=1 Tax=Boeremia exigua TaxID=749465 RepID=UPI001E8D5BD2|nr:major facilitator superfamily domain-containing protein [Boeremia exigua]KAH6614127.1 major facilitator superfamily domain-containing protein [Boeremia exigua]